MPQGSRCREIEMSCEPALEQAHDLVAADLGLDPELAGA